MGKDTHALSGAGAAHRARSARGQRRRDAHPARRRRDADAGHLARDPRPQPRPHDAPCRRHRRHAVAQSARGRRLQVQPAATAVRPTPTSPRAIEDRANELLRAGNAGVKRAPVRRSARAPRRRTGGLRPALRRRPRQRRRHGGDPRGGPEARRRSARRRGGRTTGSRSTRLYGLDIDVVNPAVDPTFSFMTVDHDGKIRMDCSSPYAMAGLVGLKDRYDVAFANDPDADRHGIVTPSAGPAESESLPRGRDPLPAHAPPAVAGRRGRRQDAGVSSGMIDRVVAKLGRRLSEVPVGFKWFAPGLLDGSFCFGGEESAGASFLRRDGTVWTTDKDGLDHEPARRRDHRAHRQGSGRALSRARPPNSVRRSTRASTRRRRPSRRRGSAASRPTR